MNFYEYAKEKNLPNFRIKQFEHAFYKELVNNFDEITVFSQTLRDDLKAECVFSSLTEGQTLTSTDGLTTKSTLKTAEGLLIETVLIQEKDRNTICVSSQIGCAMGCVFCATGHMGFTRNLTTDEIVDQVLHFARILKGQDRKVTNIVYMGMGEPLLNYENVMKSIEIITDAGKFGLGQRNITVSTVGVLPNLHALFSKKRQFRIAISLHAPNQSIREQLVPSAKSLVFNDLLQLAFAYCDQFKKRITYEYVLLAGINDSNADAEELVVYFIRHELYTHINLIMYNEVETDSEVTGKVQSVITLERSSNNRANTFAQVLRDNGIPCTIRYSQGEDIKGACGQLAIKKVLTPNF